MPFSEDGGGETIEAQHFCERRDVLRNLSGITGKSGAGFDDRAHVVHVVVVPGLEGGAGG
jgi:hypothetical protein